MTRRRTGVRADAVRTLYVGGWGRSGSTLLECLIAELDGVVVLGEVKHLWERGLGHDELCACGEPFSRCPFWTEVGHRAFGGWASLDLEHVLGLKDAVDRQRRLPQTARRRVGADYAATIAEYTDLYRRIYQAAADTASARVVVDSSKEVPTAMALSHDDGIDLRVLHIVRDSRGVAYSWSKDVARPETRGEEQMPRLSPQLSTAQWLSQNLAMAGLTHRGVPVRRIRYEDLVEDPAGVVARAWSDLGLPGEAVLPMLDARTVDLHRTHSVAGNPMRFRTGTTTIRPDAAWREDMDPRARRLVTAMSYPLLRRYGYV